MSKYKICVYAICKNEAKFVDRWMDSMQEADLVVVTDTGSTDDTVEKLRARGAIVYVEEIKPWRFDVARNISLDHVPEDVDICVCTDLDEVLEPGWRQKLERAWENHKPIHPGAHGQNGPLYLQLEPQAGRQPGRAVLLFQNPPAVWVPLEMPGSRVFGLRRETASGNRLH